MQDGVLRLVQTALRQFSAPPPVNGLPLTGNGKGYFFPPVTEQNVHEHIKNNPAANSRHQRADEEPAQPTSSDEFGDGPVSVLW